MVTYIWVRFILAVCCLVVLAAPAETVAQPSTDIYIGNLTVDASSFAISNLRNVTDRWGYDNQPFFNRDGTWFYYTAADTSGETDVFQYHLASGNLKQITDTPESEYSPTLLPDNSGFSSVRVEMDGTQRLWRFDHEGSNASLVFEDIKAVGYHAWVGQHTVVMFIVGEPHELWAADTLTGRHVLMGSPTGRSMSTIPGTQMASCVLQDDAERFWFYRAAVSEEHIVTIERTVPLLAEAQDCAWLPDGRIVMCSENELWVINPAIPSSRWTRVFSLNDAGLTSITRMAVDPTGNWFAIVAQDEQKNEE